MKIENTSKMNANKYDHSFIEKTILENLGGDETYKVNTSSNNQPYFSTVMPPPNITGVLHMGHALVLTLQDILVRYHRAKGFNTLWQAGVDHAGIATQIIVEKQLMNKGIDISSLTKEEFCNEVLKWKDISENNIINQIKKIGASCDFSDIAFTMDDNFKHSVNKVFIHLFDEGLIYKDYRLVNFDPSLKTAISDLEVVNKEQSGKFYYLDYKIENSDQVLVVATTRPETIFADQAVAVNPEDPKYNNLIGKNVIVPIINTLVPVIGDSFCDMNKGSGAVKVTPAHDFNDFEIGKRHNLKLFNILTKEGTLNENVPKSYQGLTTHQARKKITDELEDINSISKVENHKLQIPYGERSNSIIEPLLSEQWFLDVSIMAKKAISAVESGRLKIIPENWKNLYYNWLKNIKPWCISRQLMWGHPIPIWQDKNGKLFAAHNKDEASLKAQNHYELKSEQDIEKLQLIQDNSVLDTWFSSSLWPFVTLGWSGNEPEKFKNYYPTSTLITAFDIIFFWVARMVMIGEHVTGELPFKNVYFNALILDEKGIKMSKSKGNVINPLNLIDKYGSDALRFTLTKYSSHSRNIRFSEKTLEGARNFVTKIWNAYRFLEHIEASYNESYDPINHVTDSINKWLLYNLSSTIDSINKAIEEYKFSELSDILYQFVWHTYCDWYIEMVKDILSNDTNDDNLKRITKETAIFAFKVILQTLHPIMPFITEYLSNIISPAEDKPLSYQTINYNLFDKIMNNNNYIDANKHISKVTQFITKLRSLRAIIGIANKNLIDIYFQTSTQVDLDYINKNSSLIKKLCRVNKLIPEKIESNKSLFKEAITDDLLLGIDLKGLIDFSIEKKRLNKEQATLNNEILKLENRLNNESFVRKADPEIVRKSQDMLKIYTKKLSYLNNIINQLNLLK